MWLICAYCMSPAVQEVSAEMSEHMPDVEDINDIDLPMKIPDIPLMTEGVWKGIEWTGTEIRRGLENTEFETQLENEGEIEQNNALFFEHDDRDARAWIGEVENIRVEERSEEGTALMGDLVIVDQEAAQKLAYGAKFGISAKVSGITDGDRMRNMAYENFSLVLNPAVKTTFINSEDKEMALQEIVVHSPEFESTDDREWNKPNLEDFDMEGSSWDDLSEDEKSTVGDHFIVSKSGFPAETYGDMALPVVEPDRTLNLNALQNAKARAGQVEGLSGDVLDRAVSIINRLANENFPEADFESMDGHGDDEEEMSEEESEQVSEDSEDEDENNNLNEDTMGDNTPMTEDNVEPETDEAPEDGAEEVEESAEDTVDMESLKNELLDEIKAELADDEEESEDEVEDEDVEDDVEEDEGDEAEAELSDFQKFVNQNPELSPSEAAEAFEESQKSAEEKAEEKIAEVKQEMSSHIDDLKSEIEELSDSDSEPARVSKATGRTYEELSEEVEEQSREELRKGVMRKMLDQAGASHLYK